jgi:hypothetical protein
MHNNITLKSSLKSLLDIPNQVENKFKHIEAYSSLVKFIIEYDQDEDNYHIPTIKELQDITGLNHYQLNKYLIDMYKTIVDDPIAFDYQISKTEIYFIVSHNESVSALKCNQLKYIPKIGDNFTLPYLRAKFNFDMFYVNDVRQTFADDVHEIDIFLKQGCFNSYWHQRLEEAKFKRELPFRDFYRLSEWELKEKLGFSGF